MSMKTKRTTVIAKIEGTYGTDSTPTGGSNAMLFRNAKITPLNVDMQQRSLVRPFLGSSAEILAAKWFGLEIEVEMAGASAAGGAPPWGCLMRACGMGETIVAVTSVTYAPISTGEESVSAYCNYDGVLHKSLGLRGTWGLRMNARQIPVLVFTLVGLFSAVADGSLPSLTLTSWQKPKPVNNTNTTGFAVHSYAGIMSSLSIDANNVTPYQNLVGAERVIFTDRDFKGKVQVEAVTVATKDFWGALTAETIGALAVNHGSVAGATFGITSSVLQITGLNYSELDGIRMLDIDFKLVPSNAGNDEIAIAIT